MGSSQIVIVLLHFEMKFLYSYYTIEYYSKIVVINLIIVFAAAAVELQKLIVRAQTR